MKAPFVYFGGKSTIAHVVWEVLGQPKTYIEPFFGSGAVLLNRPKYDNKKHYEIVNDKDGFIANVWRALQCNPDEVAKWCDYPINHADLSARKTRLIKEEGYLLENLIKDDSWYDPKLAGYWIWASSCWIGCGLTRKGARPHLAGNQGVQEPYNENIYKWFRELSERLRYVKVVCGDWKRVCGGNWQNNNGLVGIFLDPPYGVADRDTSVYHHDSTEIAKDVLEWVKERGNINDYRIVIAGYEEYQELVDDYGWTKHTWKTGGGYGNMGVGQGKKNRYRETLFISPNCIKNSLF